MIMTEETHAFVNRLAADPRFTNLTELIYQDLEKCRTDITNMVLQGRFDLTGSWSSYMNTDINVVYEEDMLRLNELLTMHGLSNHVPTLMSDDIGMMIIYRFDRIDSYGGIMNTANVYHITVKGSKDKDAIINEWFILSD